ncbi:hypothetical protein [Paraburkholderia terrae]|uniref:hypothetical protein n=1 Tax=Paraburkholderia terrae TaxID=311230 RepID=UPI001EE2699C|nr:hypothetical protein [Paraburkholderia terrae]GJH02727.1 hypothetical protein CBA19C8_19240 [Paraburkholderia terrae]
MTELDTRTPDIYLPYFTAVDPALSRSSGGRDPLGLLPVWSAFGRRLVPNLASPVAQVTGIKAVVLIQWLADQDSMQRLLEHEGARRRFFRLMEGLLEYWLYRQDGAAHCFGSNALAAAEENFYVTATSAKTVANGLYQYYRGSCRRARLVDDAWTVEADVARQLSKCWTQKATEELIEALAGPLKSPATRLFPGKHLNGELNNALTRVFDSNTLRDTLQNCLFGDTNQQSLARDFLALRQAGETEKLTFEGRVKRLVSPSLDHEIDCVLRCEPFLLVMQDVFDYMRGSPGKRLELIAGELSRYQTEMGKRATRFLPLGVEQDSARMKHMQVLARLLASTESAASATNNAVLVTFLRELVAYHARCMKERGRDPMVVIEGDVVSVTVASDRNVQDATARLEKGHPWMNDYYLNTASNLYGQVF